MWARQCGRPWLQYRKARARVRRLHRRREALRQHKAQHTAEVAVCQAHLHDKRAELVAAHFTQHCHVALARLAVEEPTSMQIVDAFIGLGLRSTAAMN